MNKKKVCLVIHSLEAGGMERTMSNLAHYFSSHPGTETHLILYGHTRKIFYPLPDGIHIHKPSFEFQNQKRILYSLKTLFFLRNKIKKLKPDAVLSFGEYWNNFLLLALYGLKFPVFVSDRGQPGKSLGWLHDQLRKLLYPKARGLIFQTKKAKEIYLEKNKHKNIMVIGNPITFGRSSAPTVAREKIILMVGRFIKSKHQDKLIEMFAKINAPDWKLVLVGYDPLKQENVERLKILARTLRVEDRVIFSGKQADVESYYRRSAIFSFTSSSEGFPNVVGEAMLAGLPVIAFDCIAGPAEMITSGIDGILVPLFDYGIFEIQLKRMMEDGELRDRLGKEAKKSIQKFSVSEIGKKYYVAMVDL